MKTRVLFVCMGNICRSPTAHAVFRDQVRRNVPDGSIEFDSAGTHAYHVGSPPDQRSQVEAARRGIDMSDLRARQVEPADFDRFDYILAMDSANYEHLAAMCPEDVKHKLYYCLDFAPEGSTDGRRDVPDPYYGGDDGFNDVFNLVANSTRGLLGTILRARQTKTLS